MLKTLETLGAPGKRTTFSYTGSIASGVVLQQSGLPKIEASFFLQALQDFSGRRIQGGFKMDDPPPGGFGEWVQRESVRSNSRRLTPRHGSFMAAILCSEARVEHWLEGASIVLRFP
jgi:hypothetical protein